ncbi:MAG: hypothetical protein Kow0063_02850 [Anaerolineae bacterium]
MTLPDLTLSLLFITLVAPVINLFSGAVRLARRTTRPLGWLNGLLALITALGGLFVLVSHTFFLAFSPVAVALLLGSGITQVVGGLLLVSAERGREGFTAERSAGLLNSAIGFFTMVMAVFVPILPGQLFPSPRPVVQATVAVIESPTRTPEPVRSPTSTAARPVTRTATPTPTATPSATPTREPYRTPTPSATPTVAFHCGAVVNYNLNLRAAPSLDAEVLLVIPYQTVVLVGGQNEAGTWWFVYHEDTWGWVDGQYISLDTDCGTAPVLLSGRAR